MWLLVCRGIVSSDDDVLALFSSDIELETFLSMVTYVFVLQQDGKFYLDSDILFLNMGSLVEYYSTHVLPCHDSLILRCPYGYSKPRWRDSHGSLTPLRTGLLPLLDILLFAHTNWICFHRLFSRELLYKFHLMNFW